MMRQRNIVGLTISFLKINRKMKNKEYYIGQYKTTYRFTEYNYLRYTTMCMILDFYCYIPSVIGQEIVTDSDYLSNYVVKKSSIQDTKYNRLIISSTIKDMIIMGILSEDNDIVDITEMGKRAFVNQVYHKVAASLYEAKYTRRLSIIATSVAIVSVVLTLCSLIAQIYACK